MFHFQVAVREGIQAMQPLPESPPNKTAQRERNPTRVQIVRN